MIEGEHFADENHMVSAFVLERRAALETRGAILQQWRLADAVVQFDLGELVFALGGETSREVFLLRGQHVHVPMLAAAEDRQAARLLGQAPEHQRRVE
ncbi:hypothetical protein D9M71_646630 [compost metagenome]